MDNTMRAIVALVIVALFATPAYALARGGAEKPATMTIMSAYDVIDTFGIGAHVTRTTSESAENIIKMLTFLGGIKYMRTSIDMSVETTKPAAILAINAATGVKFNGLMPHNMDANYATSKAFVLANPSAFSSVEGQNEVNITPTTYNGLTSPYAERSAMSLIYNDFHSVVDVYSSTLAYFEGRQAYIDDVAAYRVLDADYCAMHAYPVGLNSSSAGGMIYTLGLNAALCNNKPPVVTETGAYTVDSAGGRGTSMGAVTEEVQAKYILNAYVSCIEIGSNHCFAYELVDGAADTPFTNKEYHFGIFRNDLKPKIAAIALQNFLGVLKDDTRGRTRDISYTITGEGVNNRHFMVQKSDGSHVLILRREVDMWDYVNGVYIPSADVPVTVTFKGSKKLSLYNPLVGKVPAVTVGSSITIDVPDHPILLKVEDL